MINTKLPLISVITVSYNAVDVIEASILSVINQNVDNYEYIIVDGGSTDGTVDVIKKYQDKITYWISETDKGIYDAMNKGVGLSKGDWCYFINAGDSFYSVDVLCNLKLEYVKDVDVVYGAINCITSSNSFLLKPKPLKIIKDTMPFSHQAVFVKRLILEKNSFDINFKISADYKLFRHLFFERYRFEEIDVVVANYEAEEGVSSTNFYEMFREYAIIKGDWNLINVKVAVIMKAIRFNLYSKIRKLIPVKWRLTVKKHLL